MAIAALNIRSSAYGDRRRRARVTAVYPLGPIFHGLGLNITVFSADGHLNIGIVSCTDQTPDPWAIANAFDDQLKQLLAACD